MEINFEKSKYNFKMKNHALEEEKAQKDEEIRLLRERLASLETQRNDNNGSHSLENVVNNVDQVGYDSTEINQTIDEIKDESNNDLNYDSDDNKKVEPNSYVQNDTSDYVDPKYDSDTNFADPNYDSSDNEDRTNDLNYD
jgi:hypothetical protein